MDSNSEIVLKELFCRKLLSKSDILKENQIIKKDKEQQNIVESGKGSLFRLNLKEIRGRNK